MLKYDHYFYIVRSVYMATHSKKYITEDGSNTLILIDWDDTLYPTTWIKKHKGEMDDDKTAHGALDKNVAKFIKGSLRYGQVVIITNASIRWVNSTLKRMPLTKKVFEDNGIYVVSARENYSDTTNDMQKWKEYAFRDVVVTTLSDHKVHHIISIGDAHYEYNALVNLCNWNKEILRILKTVKCIRSPSLDVLLDQLSCLSKALRPLYTDFDHMDLVFRERETDN